MKFADDTAIVTCLVIQLVIVIADVPLTDSLLQAGQARASVVLPRCASGIQHYPAVGSPSTVYVRCTDPGSTSVHIWRCPAPLVWNQHARGCVENNGDFGAASAKLRALPDLVGVLETESGRVVDVPAVPTLYDNRQSQLVPSYYVGSNQLENQGESFFQQARKVYLSTLNDDEGPAQSPTSGTTPVRPLSTNPCLQRSDNDYENIQLDITIKLRSSNSYYRPHPDDLSKYVECFPDRRLIVVRRCNSQNHGRPIVWSQRQQICVLVDGAVVVDGGHLKSTSSSTTTFETETVPLQSSYDVSGATEVSEFDAEQLTVAVTNPCGRMVQSGVRPAVLYYPFPGDDTKFIQCASGFGDRAFVRQCPTGLRWNRRAMTCDRTISGGYAYQWPSRSD